jgi:hypothetical protein
MTVKNLVRTIDPELHKEMALEYFAPGERPRLPTKKAEPKPVQTEADPFAGLTSVSKLPANHSVRQYVEGRCIPKFVWDDLYYTETFYTWCNSILPGRYKNPKTPEDDEPRLVIPFRNLHGKPTGFQGRQLIGAETGKKYVYLALNNGEPMIWGLNNIDLSQPIYVFEGPIDAMFIPNAIACGGGDLTGDLIRLDIPREKFVVVYDNEPRKSQTIDKIRKAIRSGFAVCIWPQLDEKDVNDMVKKNINFGLAEACEYVFAKIQQGTHSGVSATMYLTYWNRTKK